MQDIIQSPADFCRAMRDTAQRRAEENYLKHRDTHAIGAHLECVSGGLLVCTVVRREDGLWQEYWSQNDDRISRADAEDIARHHADFIQGVAA